MTQPNSPQSLAESVKRLREIESGYKDATQTPALFARDALRAVNYPEAIQTINALAQLVGEMENAIRHLDDSLYFWSGCAPKHIRENRGMEYEDDRAVVKSALKSAAPIAELAKGEL